MRQLAAMFLLLGILPVLLFGVCVECSGVGGDVVSCCPASHEEGMEDVLHGRGEEAGQVPSHHHHEHIPLLSNAGERRAGALPVYRLPLALPGGGVELPVVTCVVARGEAETFDAVGVRRPMWVPLRC